MGSVEVETNSSLYDAPVSHNSCGLNWDIMVEVEQVELLPEQEQQQLIKQVVQQVEQQQIEQELRQKESESAKKSDTSSSSSMAEERKLSKLMNPRGRKVTRMGDYLVFTERAGVLTSQNGVQQVREERVKINSEDLAKLVEMGF